MAVTMQEQQTQSEGYVVYVRDTVGLQSRYKVVHEGLNKYGLKLYDSYDEECYFDDFDRAVRVAEILRVQESTDYLILPIQGYTRTALRVHLVKPGMLALS